MPTQTQQIANNIDWNVLKQMIMTMNIKGKDNTMLIDTKPSPILNGRCISGFTLRKCRNAQNSIA